MADETQTTIKQLVAQPTINGGKKSWLKWLIILIVVLIIAGGVYWWFF